VNIILVPFRKTCDNVIVIFGARFHLRCFTALSDFEVNKKCCIISCNIQPESAKTGQSYKTETKELFEIFCGKFNVWYYDHKILDIKLSH
jgi:hypothetical protein